MHVYSYKIPVVKKMLLTLFLLYSCKFIYNVTLPEIHCIFIALPNLKSATEFPT